MFPYFTILIRLVVRIFHTDFKKLKKISPFLLLFSFKKVLVERTVAEVLPSITQNKDNVRLFTMF